LERVVGGYSQLVEEFLNSRRLNSNKGTKSDMER
jgi:hypothetical protein